MIVWPEGGTTSLTRSQARQRTMSARPPGTSRRRSTCPSTGTTSSSEFIKLACSRRQRARAPPQLQGVAFAERERDVGAERLVEPIEFALDLALPHELVTARRQDRVRLAAACAIVLHGGFALLFAALDGLKGVRAVVVVLVVERGHAEFASLRVHERPPFYEMSLSRLVGYARRSEEH